MAGTPAMLPQTRARSRPLPESAVRGDGWKMRSRSARRRMAASPPAPQAILAWWRYYRGRRAAFIYFTLCIAKCGRISPFVIGNALASRSSHAFHKQEVIISLALKEIHRMAETSPTRVRFESSQPILRVEDMAASLRFYVDMLGFKDA